MSTPTFPTLTTGGATLVELWEADSGLSLSDATAVSTWTGANGGTLTQSGGNRPTFYAKRFPQGRPCVSFAAASSQYMISGAAASTWKFLNDGSAWTAFVVWRTNDTNTSSAKYFLLSTCPPASADTGLLVFYDNNTADSLTAAGCCVLYCAASGQSVYTPEVSNGQSSLAVHDFSVRCDGTALDMYDWGTSFSHTASTSHAFNNANPTNTLTVGATGTPSFYLNGDIAAIVICKGALNATDLNAVNAYLEAKWHPAANLSKELLLDSQNIYASANLVHTTGLAVTKNVGNPVLTGGTPDHDIIFATVLGFGASFNDFRMWAGVGDGNANPQLNTGYYTSADCATWVAPNNLHQVSYGGNTNNNLLAGSGNANGDYSTGTLYNSAGPSGQKFLRVLDSDTVGVGENQCCILLGSDDGITSWSVLKDLSTAIGGSGNEGGFPVLRNDGRVSVLYEANTGGNRNIGNIISDTTDPTSTWTIQNASMLTAGGATTQFYNLVVVQHGGVWIAFPLRFNSSTNLISVDLYVSRDEGWTWYQCASGYVPLGGGGAWDQKTIFSASLVQTSSSVWTIAYTGGNQDHSVYPRNQSLGLATLGYERMASVAVPTGTIAIAQTLGVQHINDTQGASLQSAAMGSVLTSGSTILVFIWMEGDSTGVSVLSVTDLAGNTYVKDAATIAPNNFDDCEVWRAENATTFSSNKITVTASQSAVFMTFCALEATGLASSSPLDGAGSTNGGATGTNPSTGAFSTTNANDLLIATFADGGITGSITVPSGFTNVAKFVGSGFEAGSADYKIVSTTQSGINPTWAVTTAPGDWAAIGLAYKQVGNSGTLTTLANYQPGMAVVVNADASAGGASITAACLDASGNVITGYGDAQSTIITTNTTAGTITWSGGGMPAQVTRVRFTLTGAAVLYSWSLAAVTGPTTHCLSLLGVGA